MNGLEPDSQHSEHKEFFPDAAALEQWGERFARLLRPGMLVALRGDLGAGKTTLARAMLRALGVTGRIKSPTYALLETYNVSSLYLYHFDFYRIKGPSELEDAGFRDCFSGAGLCFVEWPERAGRWLPVPDITLTLFVEDAGRTLTVTADTDLGRECLDRLYNA